MRHDDHHHKIYDKKIKLDDVEEIFNGLFTRRIVASLIAIAIIIVIHVIIGN